MKLITEQFAAKFKRPYKYTMGGTQTIIFTNGQKFEFDDRKYYGGRYARKYNTNIRHDHKGVIEITATELKEYKKMERERYKELKAAKNRQIEKEKRIEDAKANGVYSIVSYEYGEFIELSDEESQYQYFDSQRLAKTLNISVEDAELLKSRGKTYVYAKNSDGNIIELYHPSLSCNDLSISIDRNAANRMTEFAEERGSWVNAPFAAEVGQTSALNHFVC